MLIALIALFLLFLCAQIESRNDVNMHVTIRMDSVNNEPIVAVNSNSNDLLEFYKRLVGGVPVIPPDRHPWAVTIFDRSNRNLLCGGALITDRHVLTAAHCFQPYKMLANSLRLRVGATGLKRSDGVKATVKRIINHENFGKPYQGRNDIAILEIDHPINLPHDEVQPICLGKKGMAEEGVMTTVVGFGRTKERGGHTTDVIMQIEIPIVADEYCMETFNRLFSEKSMICAGMEDGSRDACQGDSGGPIMVNDNGVWYVIGVVSFGSGCGRVKSYGVYTKVEFFEDWIDEMIAENPFKRC